MTQTVLPIDAVNDSPSYSAASFDDLFESVLAAVLQYDPTQQGVLRYNPYGYDSLAVTGTSSPVTVDSGCAWVKGKLFRSSAEETIAIPTPDSATRIDRIVIRHDFTASPQTCTLQRLAGTEDSGTPPSLTQIDGTTWEISLAQVSITTGGVVTVTDERVFVGNAGIVEAMLAAGAVTTAKLADGAVTTAKLADGAVTTAKIADANITGVKLADNSVDDTKVGDRVPQLYRRQGGNATHWGSLGAGGTTNYTPGPVRVQVGYIEWSGEAANNGLIGITFPVAFSARPIVFASVVFAGNLTSGQTVGIFSNSTATPTTTGCSLSWQVTGNGTLTDIGIAWMAIGPE